MPKRRQLNPQSLFDEPALRAWLVEINAKEQHLQRIWKHSETFQQCAAATSTTAGGAAPNHRMADIPQVVYDQFPKQFVHCTSRVVDYQWNSCGGDPTTTTTTGGGGGKLLIELQNGTHHIETVLIPHHHDPSRYTVCISSQVGCRMACSFCATGTMGLLANLTAGELVEQVWHAQQALRRQRSSVEPPLPPNNSATTTPATVTNVVFMGMGEPLDNYQVVKDAILSLHHNPPFMIPLARITVSTVGVVSKIRQLALDCPGVQLAVSLHAPNDTIRHVIVPTAQQYDIPQIMDAVQFYQNQATNIKRQSVMMEYIMIRGINDSIECAHELGRLLQGREFLVNLIPYNPTVAGSTMGYDSPTDEVMKAFQNVLYEYPSSNPSKPLRCTIRWSSRRGQSLDAACGQLVLGQPKNANHNHKQQQHQQSTDSGVIKDMEDYGKMDKKVIVLPKKEQKPRSTKRWIVVEPNQDKTEKEPDDEDSMFSLSFIGPILLSGLVAVGVTTMLVLLQQRRVEGMARR